MLQFVDKIRKAKIESYRIRALYVTEEETITITFNGIHVSLTNEDVQKVLAYRYCEPISVTTPKDEYNLDIAEKIVVFNRKEFLKFNVKNQIKMFGDDIEVKHHGQIEACKFCKLEGHFQRNCPEWQPKRGTPIDERRQLENLKQQKKIFNHENYR